MQSLDLQHFVVSEQSRRTIALSPN